MSKQLCITLKHDAPVEARIELGKLCRKVSKTIRLLKHESHATIQVPVTLDPEDTSKVTIDVPKGAEPGRYEGVLSDDGNVVAVIFLDIKTAG